MFMIVMKWPTLTRKSNRIGFKKQNSNCTLSNLKLSWRRFLVKFKVQLKLLKKQLTQWSLTNRWKACLVLLSNLILLEILLSSQRHVRPYIILRLLLTNNLKAEHKKIKSQTV